MAITRFSAEDDTNLYSLFVERAMGARQAGRIRGAAHTVGHLRRQDGGDGSSGSVSTSGRVGGLFDFENRRLGTGLSPFFPDVDSIGSSSASSSSAERSVVSKRPSAPSSSTTRMPSRTQSAASRWPRPTTARVNPNTGTAPVFRTRRDAEIIRRRIYERHPVLGGSLEGSDERRPWSIRFMQDAVQHDIQRLTPLSNCGATGVDGLATRSRRQPTGSGAKNYIRTTCMKGKWSQHV